MRLRAKTSVSSRSNAGREPEVDASRSRSSRTVRTTARRRSARWRLTTVLSRPEAARVIAAGGLVERDSGTAHWAAYVGLRLLNLPLSGVVNGTQPTRLPGRPIEIISGF